MKPKILKAGSSEILLREGTSKKNIILLHGYGANMQDLYPLSTMIDEKYNVYFPNGPMTLDPSGFSRAWFPIDEEALQAALMQGTHRDLREYFPPELDDRKTQLYAILDELGLDIGNTILGGFSQGAILATELMLQAQIAPKALLILSGAFIKKLEWSKLFINAKGLPIFQSHGTLDHLLAFQHAKELDNELTAAGAKLEFHEFQGSHEIPMGILEKLSDFLTRNG